MNAVAETMMQEPEPRPVRVRAEHISLDTGHDDDALATPRKRPHRPTRMSYALTSKMLGDFREDARTRNEFLRFIDISNG